LEFFVLIAKYGSLSATARMLGITPPAATARLASIEERLGVRLVNRNTRKISLTSEGDIYLQHATRLLNDLREMDELVSQGNKTPRGLLRVNAPLGFGRTMIAPLIPEFVAKYPEIELELNVTDKPVNLIEQGLDLSIRFGEPTVDGLIVSKIASNRRFLCASPLYLEKHGTPRTIEDLAQHACIVHRQNDDLCKTWKFLHNRNTESVKVRAALSSNDGDIITGWALSGKGIVIRSEWDVAKYLESGRLKHILAEYILPNADLFVYYPSSKNLPAKARVFIDFIRVKL